ncbi:hypothetical protein [Spirosoma endbachense]|uniref:Uncharacterized protein n=1 Tax=Spirosoma endbachense TaxID=2666025 RepID=A0A6P1W645_9BACT|nr:hypothetical protein [Spirosoma endbachense]QHV99196.1 hypothetical protein GJR95_31155 [Spirosoma endbachense]
MPATQQRRRVVDRHLPTTRRGHSAKPAPAKLPDRVTADAFLRVSFSPIVLEQRTNRPEDEKRTPEAVQAEFFQSLSYLATTYGFTPTTEVDTLPYPLNIGHVLTITRQQFNPLEPDARLIIIKDDKHLATLATVKDKEAEWGLYYVPVRPLYYLIQRRTKSPRTELICCIYAYLYQVAKIPYCTDDQGSYVSSEYDYIREREQEWSDYELADMEAEKDAGANYIKEINGKLIKCLKRFNKQRHLEKFARLSETFQPICEDDHTLLQVARRFLELYETFPEHSFELAQVYNYNQDVSEEEEYQISIDRRVSFIWAENDLVYQYIIENFDAEFSSGSEEGPYACSVLYDKSYATKDELLNSEMFMSHLLSSMAEFITYISKLDDAEYNKRLSTILPTEDSSTDLSAHIKA